jgi:F420-non-reducing hydrogenase large subunit
MSSRRPPRLPHQEGVVVTEGLLNRVEMAFRAYDPCFGCATHYLPGQMPMIVRLRQPDGEVIETMQRDAPW